MLLAGMSLRVSNLRIVLGEDGPEAMPATYTVAIDMWPQWLRVAIEHECNAQAARHALVAASGHPHRQKALAEEMRAGMVTISAVAFALEALALSAAARVPAVESVGRNASTGKKLAETIRQCFDLPGRAFPAWRKTMIQVFQLRNDAVHPDVGFAAPRRHPALNAAVPPPAHIYRLENAKSVVDFAFHTAKFCSEHPKARHKTLRELASAWQQYLADLEQVRSPEQA